MKTFFYLAPKGDKKTLKKKESSSEDSSDEEEEKAKPTKPGKLSQFFD